MINNRWVTIAQIATLLNVNRGIVFVVYLLRLDVN